jgi:hypothetical protein
VKSSTIVIITAFVLGTSAIGSQQAGAPSRADYGPLEFLAGSCWVGSFDTKTTDTHCFEWVYDRKFLRDRHTVSSTPPYEGETLYAWDPATRRIVFRYVSNAGLLLDGTVETHGDTISFPAKYVGGKGQIVEARPIWTRIGADTYRAVNNEKTATGWKPTFTVEYHRKR